MKAIFPDSKSLQPMPTSNVHADVSGSVNNNTVVAPNSDLNTQNVSTTQNENAPSTIAPESARNFSSIFYFIAFMLIVVIVIITHKKLRRVQ